MPMFPREIPQTTIPGLNGFRIGNDLSVQVAGSPGGDDFGQSVRGVGDVNGDGIADFIVGAPLGELENLPGNANVGEVWLIFGTSNGFPRDMSLSSINGSNGVRITAAVTSDGPFDRNSLGRSISSGDFNNDGLKDILIGAPGFTGPGQVAEGGQVFVIYGRQSWSSIVDVLALNGTDGYRTLIPSNAQGVRSGNDVAGLGDVNNDGFEDYGVADGRGSAFIVFGGPKSGQASFNLSTPPNGGVFIGRSTGIPNQDVPSRGPLFLSAAGDVNNDGVADIFVNASNAGELIEGSPRGRGYILYGQSDGTFGTSQSINLESLASSDGTIIVPSPPPPGSAGGTSFPNGNRDNGTVNIGDVNGDGIADIAVTDPLYGKVYVVYGRNGGFGATLNLNNFTPSDGAVIDTGFGTTGVIVVSGAGDMNGDGVADLAIGLPGVATTPAPLAGLVHVVFGKAGGLASSLHLGTIARDQGFRITGDGEGAFQGIGGALSSGDFNGDGKSDLLIGTGVTQNSGTPSAGFAYVIYGKSEATGPVVRNGTADRDGLWGGEFNDTLNGVAGNDIVEGFGGDDSLTGGTGYDILRGGTGNDTYFVDHWSDGSLSSEFHVDKVDESVGEGFDTVVLLGAVASPNSVSLNFGLGSSEIERVLITAPGINVAGNDFATEFRIQGAQSSAEGLGGNDTFFFETAGSGTGGFGDDTFHVLVAGVSLREFEGQGTDTVIAHVDFSLGNSLPGNVEFFENLILMGSAISGTGNTLDNQITGNAQNNVLNGNEGNDLITGGAGDDTIGGGTGIDTARFAASFTDANIVIGQSSITVSTTLDGTDTLTGIERLEFAGRAVDVSGLRLGTDNAETLTGDAADNLLSGRGGNDILFGGGGSDLLDGGSGFDEARYVGSRKTYAVSVVSEPGSVASRIAFGPEGGTDTLRNVEQARFTDGVLSFDPAGNAAKVLRMYDATLQRAPDTPGFEFWLSLLNNGTSLTTMAQAFAATGEFTSRFGNLNNQQFVEQMYIAALGRPGDSGGVQFWTGLLNNGTTRGEVLRDFSETGEHVTRTSGALAQGLWIADPNARVAARMYDAALDRLPDSGGLAAWTNALNSGLSVIDLAGAFAGSQEFVARYSNLTNQQFVEQLYVFALNRPGDSAGVGFWTSQLANGQSRAFVLAEFSETSEHVSNTAPLWYDGISVVDGVSHSASAATGGSASFGDLASYDFDALLTPAAANPAASASSIELGWEAALATMTAQERVQDLGYDPARSGKPMFANTRGTASLDTNQPVPNDAFAETALIPNGCGLDLIPHEFVI